MSSIKDKLKQQSKAKLAVTTEPNLKVITKTAVVTSEIDKITYEIKSNLDEIREIQQWWDTKKTRVTELKTVIIEQLIYVRDNKKALLHGITFEDYLTNEIGISKGYFYNMTKALEIASEFKKPGLVYEADPKLIIMSQQFEDKKVQKAIIDKAGTLTREDMKTLQSQGSITAEYVESYIPISERMCTVKKTKDKVFITINSEDESVFNSIMSFLKKNQYM